MKDFEKNNMQEIINNSHYSIIRLPIDQIGTLIGCLVKGFYFEITIGKR